MQKTQTSSLISIVKLVFRRVYFNIVVRFFTLPSLFAVVGLYILALEIPFDVLGVQDENWNIFGQTGSFILGDTEFYDNDLPYLLTLVLTIVSIIESTVYNAFFSSKISFPRFLYAYKSFLIMLVPVWAIFITLISFDYSALIAIPYAIFGQMFIWPLLNGEYALYAFADKHLAYHKIREKKLNQKARAPWTAMQDLWKR